jgi:hypothetical protein
MDLAAPQPKLTVQMATVRGKPCVAKAVQHVPKQDRKPGAVQPVTTEPSVGSKGGVGVVIHLSKTREKRINISSIEQRQQTKTPKINHDDSKTLTQILFSATTISQNSADWDWYRIRKNTQYRSDREFWDISRKHKYTLIRPTVQELRSLKFREGVSSGQIELSGQLWTFSPLPNKTRKNLEYQNPREILTLSNGG